MNHFGCSIEIGIGHPHGFPVAGLFQSEREGVVMDVVLFKFSDEQ
jgi:hypothetical protein